MAKKKTTKPTTPRKVISVADYTPYIVALEEIAKRDKQFLDDINSGTIFIDPRTFGLETEQEIFEKIHTAWQWRLRVLRNWEIWAEMTAPLHNVETDYREMLDLSDPNNYWYEADIDEIGKDEYTRRITKHTGKWRDIISLRGASLFCSEKQYWVLRDVYITVMTAYVYAQGFSNWDAIGIVPHENWREKMGAGIVDSNGKWKVIINK